MLIRKMMLPILVCFSWYLSIFGYTLRLLFVLLYLRFFRGTISHLYLMKIYNRDCLVKKPLTLWRASPEWKKVQLIYIWIESLECKNNYSTSRAETGNEKNEGLRVVSSQCFNVLGVVNLLHIHICQMEWS